jgi:predicted type IV restriction endonuclease
MHSGKALPETVQMLRTQIERFRERGQSIGELNTRAVLIDPLLSALGWELLDLSEVKREYRRKPQDNPVDYALFILRRPCLFVEAKDLDSELSDRRWVSQILGYATVVGVEWCVLTDGDEYRLYNAHAPVEVDEKLFRCVRISNVEQEKHVMATLDLLSKAKMGDKLIDTLWKSQFVDRNVNQALDRLLHGEDRNLVRWVHKQKPELSLSDIRESLKRAEIRIDFPVVEAPIGTGKKAGPKTRAKSRVGVTVGDLIAAGLVSPPSPLHKTYKGTSLRATVQMDGSILYDGRAYKSLSTAAGMARKSVIGAPPGRKYPQTNGWTFWKIRDPATGKVEEIDILRQRCLKQKAARQSP